MGKNRAAKLPDAWKRKKWIPILAPAMFRHMQIGETLALEKEEIVGKKITVNLSTVYGDMKRKDTEATFEILAINDGKATTRLVGYEVLQSSIKRLVRRGRDRLDESMLLKTKDDVIVRVKPLALTMGNTNSSVQRALRYVLRKSLLDYAAATEYEAFVNDVLAGKLQREVGTAMRKVYPLKSCEIRRFTLVPVLGQAKLSTLDVKMDERLPQDESEIQQEVEVADSGSKLSPQEQEMEQEAAAKKAKAEEEPQEAS